MKVYRRMRQTLGINEPEGQQTLEARVEMILRCVAYKGMKVTEAKKMLMQDMDDAIKDLMQAICLQFNDVDFSERH